MSLFNLGLSGLLASQSALRTTGHNIANVHTEGYSRQRVELGTRPAQGTTDGFFGTGVQVTSVTRQLDSFIQTELRISAAGLQEATTFHDLAAQIDNFLADPVGGLSPAIQRFFEGMHAVAADPSSVPARQVLMSDAEGLVQRFQTLERRLGEISSGLNQQIEDTVGEINTFAQEIARLNQHIVRDQAAFSDQPPNDLLDQRDTLVGQLAQRIDVLTFPQSNGALNIMVGSGQGLVTGENAARLDVIPNAFDSSERDIAFTVAGSTSTITNLVSGGELAGALRFRTEVLDVAMRDLGHLATGIATTLNEQHAVGQTLTGALGGNLFTPLDQLAPAVFASNANSGAPPADMNITVSDIGQLPASDYLLERVGATHQLTRLSDGTVFALTGFPAVAEEVDGLRLSLSSGVVADGDRFLIQPSRDAIRNLSVVPTSPHGIAAAAPVRSSAALTNNGDAVISAPSVNLPSNELTLSFGAPPTSFDIVDVGTGAALASNVPFVSGTPINFNGLSTSISGAPVAGDVFSITNTVTAAGAGNGGTGAIALATVSSPDPNLSAPVTITFGSGATFDVTGAVTGSPTIGVSYVSGTPISFNGWTLEITGSPQAGDVFTVTPNSGGVGDNRNALALAQLQTTLTVDGERSTFEEFYGQLVAGVGSLTRQAELNQAASATLHEQLFAQREMVSGVNLDEEAANLLRFQQAFQASAQLIAVADEVFNSLLSAVGR